MTNDDYYYFAEATKPFAATLAWPSKKGKRGSRTAGLLLLLLVFLFIITISTITLILITILII